MSVHAVVVTYRDSSDLARCISSLLEAAVADILVLDNGSPADDMSRISMIASEFSAVEFHAHPRNSGFAAGVNEAVSRIAATDDDMIWVVNPDLVVDKGCLAEMLAAVQAHGLDLVSPAITTTNHSGAEVVWFCGGDLDTRSLSTRHRLYGAEASRIPHDCIEATFATGAALLFTMHAWQVLGGFSEEYFLYWEDADLSMRANRLGLRMGTVTTARAWHRVGGSGSGTGMSSTYYYFMQRNRVLFARNFGLLRNLFSPPGLLETMRMLGRPLREPHAPWRKATAGARGLWAGLTAVARSAPKETVA